MCHMTNLQLLHIVTFRDLTLTFSVYHYVIYNHSMP